jgi:hypothetical protein
MLNITMGISLIAILLITWVTYTTLDSKIISKFEKIIFSIIFIFCLILFLMAFGNKTFIL